MSDLLRYLITNSPQLLERTSEHLAMTMTAVGLAILVGVPLGVLIERYRPLANPVMGLCNTIQTIPVLAFVGFMIPVTGLGERTAVVILFAYSLLPIVQNTYIGLSQIDAGMIAAARGMGMTSGQILWKVRLPLALPVVAVGLRLAVVIGLGTASVMSLAGAGGLGQIIFAGITRVNDKMVLAGALPAALLSVLADWALRKVERWLTPRGIRLEPETGAQADRSFETRAVAPANQ